MKYFVVGILCLGLASAPLDAVGNNASGLPETNQLTLKVASNSLILAVGDLKIRTNPDNLNFAIIGPYGVASFYLGAPDVKLASIDVKADTPAEKCAVLNAVAQSRGDERFDLSVTLTARVGQPGIKVESIARNTGEYPGKIYYFFRLIPIHSNYYYDEDGEQSASKKEIPIRRWLYLPINNTVGGFGLAFPDNPKFTFSTLYPREDWRKVGWYFIPKLYSIFKPGEENRMAFRIFPAIDADEAAESALPYSLSGVTSLP